jgi:hypothetical protein
MSVVDAELDLAFFLSLGEIYWEGSGCIFSALSDRFSCFLAVCPPIL